MKKTILSLLATAALLLSCNNEAAKTDAETTPETAPSKEEAWVPVDSATMMKNMMDYATPGPMHTLMASWNGTWKDENTMWEFEGASPQTAEGTTVFSTIMDGKYQQSTHTGTMMGMPFEGHGLLAYDNALKEFVYTWIDNWGTGIMTMTGQWDEANKTMTLAGSMPDVNRPGKQCNMREVIRMIDENTQHMEMYGPDMKTGKEYKMLEIKMTRVKK